MEITEQTALIVAVDRSDYGLSQQHAAQVEEAFKPMLARMTELEKQFVSIDSREITPELCKEARRLRLDFVSVRTGTEKIHKEAKQYHLEACKFVDAWKRTQRFASMGREDRLREIEDHFKIIEEQRKKALHEARKAEIAPYEDPFSTSSMDFSVMTDEVWANFLSGTRDAYERKQEAEQKAEAERLAALQAEQERIRLQAEENARLKAEAEEREKEIAAERAKAEAEAAKRELELQKERRAAEEERLRVEAENERIRKEQEAAAEKIRQENEAKLAEEARKRAAAEAELERQRQARLEADRAAKAALEAKKARSEWDKYFELVDRLEALPDEYSFESDQFRSNHVKVREIVQSAVAILRGNKEEN